MNSVHKTEQRRRWYFRRFAIPILTSCVLAGCSGSFNHADNNATVVKLPEKRLTDFLLTQCDDIWQLQGPQADLNPTYWLRGIDCSQRLNEQQMRQQASNWHGDSWQDVFKRTILLTNVKLQPEQRHLLLTQLDSISNNVPSVIWPLYQLWRNAQYTQQVLTQERNRYRKLQQNTDNELDTLRQQLQESRQQLNQTTQKLESLTDIERQLSTRKASEGYIPPASHGADSKNTENKNESNKNESNKNADNKKVGNKNAITERSAAASQKGTRP